MRDPMNQELDDLRAELAAVKSQRDDALSNEGYKDNVLGDMSGYVQAQYAIKDSRIRALEAALRNLLADMEASGHVGLHLDDPSVIRASALLNPPHWRGYCECEWDKTRAGVIVVHPACRFHAPQSDGSGDANGA